MNKKSGGILQIWESVRTHNNVAKNKNETRIKKGYTPQRLRYKTCYELQLV